MRPPTALEAVAVYVASAALTRALIKRTRKLAPKPWPTDSLGRPIEDGVNGWIDPEPVWDPMSDPYGVRYGRGRTDGAN